jgi:peptide/nickel transport system substrate-binding protein
MSERFGEMIERVRAGGMTRRTFIDAMVGLGLTASHASHLLGAAGVASADPRLPSFVPSRRGGGGELKIIMWDAPTLLHPHFGRGLRDFTASRIFYEPLASPTPDGTYAPVLAEEIPTLANGGIARDGMSMTWKLKRGVVWHDGAPFTADDVVFNWEFAVDPATTATTRAGFQSVARVERLDTHTVKVVFTKPQPYWDLVFTGGGLLPRHVFSRLKGAGAREAVGHVKPVGTGPYRLVDFKPGDLIRAEINLNYHVPNRPFFDRLEIKGGGDAVSAARAVLQTGEYDFAYYILAEEEVLQRIEQGGKGRIILVPGAGVSHIQCNQTDPWREVDGERSSVRTTHFALSDRTVRRAINLLVDRASIQDYLVGRSGRIAENFLVAPHRCRSTANGWEFNVDKAGRFLDEVGWVRGPDGIRSRGGQRLKLVFQAGAAASVQKVQAVVKQAAVRAGIEVEIKAVPLGVFFSADTNNPDTNVRFQADLQMYTVFSGLDPQFYMAQFVSWEIPARENKWTGRNLTRWRNAEYDRLWREADSEMDPFKRADLFIRMNDMVVQDSVVIPITQRNILHASSHQIEGFELNGWDSIFGNIAYWYRRASVAPAPPKS